MSDGTTTDLEAIEITKNEVNTGPVEDFIADYTDAPDQNGSINELVPLAFTATATDFDIPPNILTWTLEPGSGPVPEFASITPSGDFTWTPSEAQGPGSFNFKFVVTDGEFPRSETVTFDVNEVNVVPVLDPVGNKAVNELAELAFTATATDVDIPPNTLPWPLASGADPVPVGASVTPSGDFTWTPS